MGIMSKILGKDKEKAADDAAEKGSWLPGPLGDALRGYKLLRKSEEEVNERRK